MKKVLAALAIIVIVNTKIYSEYTIGFVGGKNSGEHIFETGNKHPNLSGIRGGSRITYNRDFPYGGLEFNYFKDKIAMGASFQTTGWYVHTDKMSRDEDFLMGSFSTERGRKFSLAPLFLYDTAHTFTGTQNFADGYAKSVLSQNKTDVNFRYYLGKAKPDLWASPSGFFLAFNLNHTFFKYYLYDVIQYVNKPFYYGPIGLGLSYSFTGLEAAIGSGYFHNFGKVKLESSFSLLAGYTRYRDFHVQRALNFRGEGGGSGFLFKISFMYEFSKMDLLRVSYIGHRYFSESHFRTYGGLTSEDVASNFTGKFHSYINTKETFLEFTFLRKLKN